MKKILCLLSACFLMLLMACGISSTPGSDGQTGQDSSTDKPDKAAQAAFAASSPTNDTDIGLKNIKIDTAQADLTDQQKLILRYFDNDYLDVPSYEFLQRYPKVYAGTNIHLDGEVAKIISEDGERYEIVL